LACCNAYGCGESGTADKAGQTVVEGAKLSDLFDLQRFVDAQQPV
jgi:hypothetical protein